MITQTYRLDLIPNGEPLVVHASQYDEGARVLAFDLYVGGVSFEMPSGASATIKGTKPDGTSFMYAMDVDGSTVSIPIELQMAAVYGQVDCEIQISGGNSETLGTANFILEIERSALDSSQISETDIPVFEQLVTQARDAAADASGSAHDANISADNADMAYQRAAALIPASGTEGAFLQKTASGAQWTTVPAGHTIEDTNGALTQRTILKFEGGVEVSDDPTNEATVIDITGVTDLEVVIAYSNGAYSANHTYAEVLANIATGGTPYVRYGTTYYPLRSNVTASNVVTFSITSGTAMTTFSMFSSGEISYGYSAISTTWTQTIADSAWTNGEATITSSNITANNTIVIGYPASMTDADFEILKAADIRVTAQAAGSITLKCLGEVPASAITLQLTRWL